MTALMHQLRTGEGQFVDVSQTQATSATVPEALLDFSANQRIAPRVGNEDSAMAPHGCYPCAGDDRWVVIAVSTDDQWQSLCRLLKQEEWLQDRRFSDGLSRWQNRLELDAMLPAVTREWDSKDLMNRLQATGIAAGAVMDSSDLLFDPHLLDRKFYELVPHHHSTGMPPLPYASRPWKFETTPPVQGKAGPTMGQHNQLVLGDLLGISEEGMAELEAQRIIGYAPTNPRAVSRPLPEEQVRLGRMQRYDADYRERLNRYYGTG